MWGRGWELRWGAVSKATCSPSHWHPDKACAGSGACPGNFCGISNQGVSGSLSCHPSKTVLPGQPSQVHPICLNMHPKSLPAISRESVGEGYRDHCTLHRLTAPGV